MTRASAPWRAAGRAVRPILGQRSDHTEATVSLKMECSWDRSIEPNRAPKYIVFAEGTEDEMCFGTYSMIPDDPDAAAVKR